MVACTCCHDGKVSIVARCRKQTVVKIVSEEGFHAPFKGLVPGLHRQFLFTGG